MSLLEDKRSPTYPSPFYVSRSYITCHVLVYILHALVCKMLKYIPVAILLFVVYFYLSHKARYNALQCVLRQPVINMYVSYYRRVLQYCLLIGRFCYPLKSMLAMFAWWEEEEEVFA